MRSNFEIFSQVQEEEMHQIALKFVPIEFKNNEFVLKAGEMGDYIVVLYSGQVKILRPSNKIELSGM